MEKLRNLFDTLFYLIFGQNDDDIKLFFASRLSYDLPNGFQFKRLKRRGKTMRIAIIADKFYFNGYDTIIVESLKDIKDAIMYYNLPFRICDFCGKPIASGYEFKDPCTKEFHFVCDLDELYDLFDRIFGDGKWKLVHGYEELQDIKCKPEYKEDGMETKKGTFEYFNDALDKSYKFDVYLVTKW